MRVKLSLLIVSILTVTACGAVYAVEDRADGETLTFDVYLDDSKIGNHRYEFVTQQDGRKVISEANFDVKFLFFTAYRYRHRNAEQWTDNCLEEIDAETNANGKQTSVSGSRTDAGFVVTSGAGPVRLPECVMTFAYWNPSFLESPRLLNPQTGEFLDVSVEKLEPQPLTIGGEDIVAKPFRLTARGMHLTVWYSPNDEWLALESTAKGGRILRYERV